MTRPNRADVLVREMADLGAVFQISDEERWIWEPGPNLEIMRNAIRRFWSSVADQPSGRDMVAAIRRLQGGAP